MSLNLQSDCLEEGEVEGNTSFDGGPISYPSRRLPERFKRLFPLNKLPSLFMLKVRRGQLVLMNSTVGSIAKASLGHYAATKHALKALDRRLPERKSQSRRAARSQRLSRTHV